jgi:hypothetical protein
LRFPACIVWARHHRFGLRAGRFDRVGRRREPGDDIRCHKKNTAFAYSETRRASAEENMAQPLFR